MSAEDLKAHGRRFFEEWNKGKEALMAALEESCATDIVYYPPSGEEIRGLENVEQYLSGLFNAFPDNYMTIDDVVVEGDKIATRWTWTGTHKGEWRGVPPTNKKLMGWGIIIDRVVGGKVVELWERFDTLGLMQQLGVIPTPKTEP